MDAPSSLWIVLDPKAGPEFAAAWREGAHEHIKDCLDGGTNEAARWVVREYVPIAEVERLRAQVEDLTADRDSWLEQASARTADAVQFMQERDAARAEIEALRRANVKLIEHDRELCSRVDPLYDERDTLRAEVEALRADAARYRWLRKYAGRGAAGSIFDHFSGTAIDECIDAARAAQGGEHG